MGFDSGFPSRSALQTPSGAGWRCLEKDDKKKEKPEDKIGLPQLFLVYKDEHEEGVMWEQFDEKGIEMDYSVVMHPLVEGETLDAIYLNMDSSVLKNYKSKWKSAESLEVADKRYISAVYFHTLFLYMITRNRKYTIYRGQEDKPDEEVDLTDYLKDIFQSYYSEFLLNFEMSELIASLEE